MHIRTSTKLKALALAAALIAGPVAAQEKFTPPPAGPDGAHDFDFLIGSWKAHLRRRLDPLSGADIWVDYDGTSVTRHVLDSHANLEAFDVDSPASHLHIHGETLRLYDIKTHQWAIYLLDVTKGALSLPATVGVFTEGRGNFFDEEQWRGRWILVRYQWTHVDPGEAHMEQAFSTDGGKTWEVNWICELTRVGA
jgi:hypothetical protein